jgi:ketosteroid isomerase-like protein
MKKLVGITLVVAAVTATTVVATGGAASAGPAHRGQGAAVAEIHILQATFHHAVSGGGHIDELMSLWADDATFTVGGNTLVGKDAIRTFFLNTAPSFQHPTWVSLSPSWKTEIHVHGNRAHIYFECHFADLATGALVAPAPAYAGGTFDGTATRTNGRWLFQDVTAGTAPLTP